MVASELSTDALTSRAIVVALAALAFLVLLGRLKPARRRWWIPRGHQPPVALLRVERAPVPLYRSPRWWERFAAITGLTVITAVLGAVAATLFAAALVWLVTTMTGMLG